MGYRFGARSEELLTKLDERMARVVRRALGYGVLDFTVIETVRTFERQQEMVRTGMSKTLKSRHLPNRHGLSEAVDIVPYPLTQNGRSVWSDTERFAFLSGIVMAAAAEEGVPVRWGGDWDGDGNIREHPFVDMPHFELR